MLTSYITFFKTHERAILVLATLAVLGFGVNKYLDKSYDAAVARQQAAQQVLQDQVSKNNELQKNVDSLQQHYGQLLDTLTHQNATLIASISTRNAAVNGQQKVDAGLPGAALAARHEALVGPGVNYTENGFLISPPVELQTVQSLETLPVLQADLKDEQTLAANKDQQITSITTVVNGLNDQVSGLKLQLTDTSKACDARVAVVRKSRWKWFKYGFITGFLGGAYVGHKIP